MQKIEGVGFTEAVERLAGRYGVELRYDDDGQRRPAPRPRPAQPGWSRRTGWPPSSTPTQLATPGGGRPAGTFLDRARLRPRRPPSMFGVGFAPRGGDALLSHLRQQGLHATTSSSRRAWSRRATRGPYDRFRGRLLWPIRELSGDVVGFGARRLFDDDRIEAKYLNTPETPIYKKSQLLYGVDLARKEIARSSPGGRRRGLHRRDGLPPRRA